MTPSDFIAAARVPERLRPQSFGPWRIERWYEWDIDRSKLSFHGLLTLQRTLERVGFPFYTLLRRHSWATIHLEDSPEVVMEDSKQELRKHLPIWLNAKGSVLVTGLGLGCVVRGLLASKQVEHITVVEIDRSILRIVGHEFEGNSRIKLIQGDALKVQFNRQRFDYAWHDLWTDGGENLQVQHMRLIVKFSRNCATQGCWGMPRFLKRKLANTIPVLK